VTGHPVAACNDPHLLCPQHDRPFYPRNDYDQETTVATPTDDSPEREAGRAPAEEI
jgi:hypothetical protein